MFQLTSVPVLWDVVVIFFSSVFKWQFLSCATVFRQQCDYR